MPFSHHSHSGQFCGHGENSLEEMVQTAILKKMDTYILTEHMPREQKDLYPEEQSSTALFELFDEYHREARRLQTVYASKIDITVGMEVDWIRPSSKEFIEALLSKYGIDVFIGSVHHVHMIPIDFSRLLYVEAQQKSGGTDEKLFEDYFDAQLEILQALRPPIIGHFDLIRLLSDDPNQSFSPYQSVWQKIVRNLTYIQQYGGVLELNTAALRKGMAEPYPKGEICKEFLAMGGLFTLSDDAHNVSQVGTHYKQVLDFLKMNDFPSIVVFSGELGENGGQYSRRSWKSLSTGQLGEHSFFA